LCFAGQFCAPWRESKDKSLAEYVILFAIVFGVNLMPAFGPPTWSVIVAYSINSKMSALALVPVAALAAASGRFILAHAFRLLAGHVSKKTRSNVAAARALFERRKRNSIIALGLFALSPVPSAQLFEAAGLARIPLPAFTAAFFTGRLLSYSLYLLTARTIASTSLGETFHHSITSPVGITLQISMIALLITFTRIDWAKHLSKASK
jgi:membrane protein YqaA with SNARE-associated domain